MFTEASTVENLVRDLLCGGVTHHTAVGPGLAIGCPSFGPFLRVLAC